MFRRWLLAACFFIVIAIAAATWWWTPALWSLVIFGPLIFMTLHDSYQTKHAILRNFPVVGRLRYLFEMVRPEMQQYFIESNIDSFPIAREMRSVIYQRAKGDLETKAFGTQRDVYRVGYEWAAHALAEAELLDQEPRILVGGPDCAKPYSSSRLNISAMSFGALSPTAIRALNSGARIGNFAHNTGEGGVSPYHRAGGGDLVWQIGTAYFGCRTPDGGFDLHHFKDTAQDDQIRMIEIKLSQGAKPGHGGVLPACKVTPEIAKIRHVPVGLTVLSPPRHSTFSTPIGLLEYVAQLRELSGGKPVGFKICIGRRTEFLAICKAMIQTGITPDFITIDGGEGGTGAAPLEFTNSIGMPARDAWAFAHSALVGVNLRDRVRVFGSGKILTGFHMIRAMALGVDACNSARGMMLALGCIQALRCNHDTCPTGVATQNPALYKALVFPDKAQRVAKFHKGTIESFLELLGAMGLSDPHNISPEMLYRRAGDMCVRSYDELYDFLEPGQLLDGADAPESWKNDWRRSQADSFTSV